MGAKLKIEAGKKVAKGASAAQAGQHLTGQSSAIDTLAKKLKDISAKEHRDREKEEATKKKVAETNKKEDTDKKAADKKVADANAAKGKANAKAKDAEKAK